MADAVSYASRISGAGGSRRGMAMYGSVDASKMNSKFPSQYYSNAQPIKQARFNEEFDAKSRVSHAQAVMSAKNLASFTPNLKAGSKPGGAAQMSSASKSSALNSRFSVNRPGKRTVGDIEDYKSAAGGS